MLSSAWDAERLMGITRPEPTRSDFDARVLASTSVRPILTAESSTDQL